MSHTKKSCLFRRLTDMPDGWVMPHVWMRHITHIINMCSCVCIYINHYINIICKVMSQHVLSGERGGGGGGGYQRHRAECQRTEPSTCVCHDTFTQAHSYVWHDTFICVTCLIHVCTMGHSHVWQTHSSVQRGAFTCVTCLDITHVWHVSISHIDICWTWLFYMCDVAYSYKALDGTVWVYACIYVCIYLYMNICIYVYMYIYIRVCIYIYVYIYVYIMSFTSDLLASYAHICIYIHMYAINVHMCVWTHGSFL